MKHVLRSGLLSILALALAGCGAAASASQAQSTAANGNGSSSGFDVQMTDTTRLMLGTLKLKDVGLQPDAKEASQLLTLWQAYQSVVTSDTAAPAEADAVVKQIRATMTSQQLDAITGMNLTQDDLRSFFEAFRQQASTNGNGSSNGSPRAPGAGGGAGPGFFPPDAGGRQFGGGGGFGGGGAFGPASGTLTPQQQATAQARRDSFRNGPRAGLFLLRPLIAELKTLAGA
jgi:hypothetical protein